MDFIEGLTHGSHHKAEQNSQDPTPAPPQRHGESGNNLFEELADKLNISEASPPPPPPPPEPKSIFEKLGDAVDTLNGKTTPPPPPPTQPENILEKIGDVLKGEEAPPPPPPKPEGIFDKISDVLHGKHEEPPKPKTFGDKIEDEVNNALGGGSRGEAREGQLDKAIDFVQEHFLKEGQQKNESVIEQAKDREIANVIRHGFESVTGK